MKTFRILVAIAALALAGGASGQTLLILHSFNGTDGDWPNGLIQGNDGNLYGTTTFGGASNAGTVFRISPSGDLTNLHSFSGSDGSEPWAGLVQGSDGSFYGTTHSGGTTNFGTVFRISPTGSFTNLFSFDGSDGVEPDAGLVQGTDGNFYGTTSNGKAAGTVFRISPSGIETNLHSFLNSLNGAYPEAGLVQGSDGNFHGTASQGGTNSLGWFQGGIVFRISPSGTFVNLYSFRGSDGAYPQAGLVQGSDGNFYGTTQYGGTNGNYGTVYQISPNGSLTSLHSFSGGDGKYPQAELVQGSDDNFYGTTRLGGAYGAGTVFRISPNGNLTNFYSFTGGADGSGPSRLMQGSDGVFYGTTASGSGASSNGTVFRICVALNPPANQISGFQPSSGNLVFTIPSVAGETYQLQFATDLVSGNWSNVVGVCVSNSIGAALTVTNFGGATGPQGFYRFAITP